jgi:hypothetical protein
MVIGHLRNILTINVTYNVRRRRRETKCLYLTACVAKKIGNGQVCQVPQEYLH